MSEYLKDDIDEIIPELPIRTGTVKPEFKNTKHSERSYKVDFFAIGNKGVNYLVEFKNDAYILKFNPKTIFLPILGISLTFNIERCDIYSLFSKLFMLKLIWRSDFLKLKFPPKLKCSKL
jgi:hypothetical protein